MRASSAAGHVDGMDIRFFCEADYSANEMVASVCIQNLIFFFINNFSQECFADSKGLDINTNIVERPKFRETFLVLCFYNLFVTINLLFIVLLCERMKGGE